MKDYLKINKSKLIMKIKFKVLKFIIKVKFRFKRLLKLKVKKFSHLNHFLTKDNHYNYRIHKVYSSQNFQKHHKK